MPFPAGKLGAGHYIPASAFVQFANAPLVLPTLLNPVFTIIHEADASFSGFHRIAFNGDGTLTVEAGGATGNTLVNGLLTATLTTIGDWITGAPVPLSTADDWDSNAKLLDLTVTQGVLVPGSDADPPFQNLDQWYATVATPRRRGLREPTGAIDANGELLLAYEIRDTVSHEIQARWFVLHQSVPI